MQVTSRAGHAKGDFFPRPRFQRAFLLQTPYAWAEMIGVYDFCGHYEWTFDWLEKLGGHEMVRAYWDEAIRQDSQRHASALIMARGLDGMEEYWGHTLGEEGGEWEVTKTDAVFRIDMHHCPSKGFLLRNGLEQYPDYCDHCMGWIGPLMREAGFTVDHEHNHCGQCWWEMRRKENPGSASAPGGLSGSADVRLCADWNAAGVPMDRYACATDPEDKLLDPADPGSQQGC